MRITHILFNKKNEGVSTILGTLIFIGILFTSVIPMMLVMKQADTIYTQKVHEIEIKDVERAREKLTFTVYAVNSTNQIKVKVDNKGDVPVKIVRVWTNDESHTQNEAIKAGSNEVLGPLNVTVENNSTVNVKVVTERGNIFASIGGGLYYSEGQWYSSSLGILVNIVNAKGEIYRIILINGTWSEQVWQSSGAEQEDTAWATITVDDPGSYTLDIERKLSQVVWKDLIGTPVDIEILWPDGPPVVLVVVSGGKTK